MTKTVEQAQAENTKKFMADGPRWRSDWNGWIEAVDEDNLMVMLGGLGCMGCGSMPMPLSAKYRQYPGFDTAPRIRIERED